MTKPDHLGPVLAALDATSAGLTVIEIARGVSVVAPSINGVGAFIAIRGTLYVDLPAGDRIAVPAGRALLLPFEHQGLLSAGNRAVEIVDGADCAVRRQGWLISDATRGRAREVIVAAVRITGTTADTLHQPHIARLTAGKTGRQLFDLLRSQFERDDSGAMAMALSLVGAGLIHALRTDRSASGVEGPAQGAIHSSLHRAITHVQTSPGDAHSVDSLAQTAGMSRSTFVRQFAKHTKATPMEFILRVRLEEAAVVLRSSALPVKTVAAQLGFRSRSHFSRAFRAAYGTDPSDFRLNVPEPDAA